MKKYIILIAILFTGTLFAQESKPVLELFGKKIRATYFYENGNILQQGFFENGKLEGVWVAFDEQGNKTSMGEYTKGIKTGKWFFWSRDNDVLVSNLFEVDYSSNKIADIKNWKQNSLADGY
ncbi:toxin-antitoxin system YwqK family antitoxin [Flavobacterium cellulosilyticum]|uniref:Membrane-binding protein n=1 Tax=Flavobacterium cellulosilyticum TaxID=2541731 RepID=A0A4R5CKX9_9FLAO|nr:membrane-binding protein [Flavobacterium cellulosilyticum]TDD99280.1 membrane-binding protein [Flavobacterium cellulosilyticum]